MGKGVPLLGVSENPTDLGMKVSHYLRLAMLAAP